jgi:hypothetical protein
MGLRLFIPNLNLLVCEGADSVYGAADLGVFPPRVVCKFDGSYDPMGARTEYRFEVPTSLTLIFVGLLTFTVARRYSKKQRHVDGYGLDEERPVT